MRNLLICLLLTTFSLNAQVGIGTTAPDGALDVTSTNDGVLLPRVALTSTTDILTIPVRTTSELIYNTATVSDVTPGYYYWNGGSWTKLAASGGTFWNTTGNAATTPGTWAAPGTNFIGTTDAQDLFIRSGNVNAVRVTPNGRMDFGALGSNNIKYNFDITGTHGGTNMFAGMSINYRPDMPVNAATSALSITNGIPTAAYANIKQGISSTITAIGTGGKTGIVTNVNSGATCGHMFGVSTILNLNNTDIAFTRTNIGVQNLFQPSFTYQGKIFGINNIVLPAFGANNAGNSDDIIGVRNDFTIISNGKTYGAHTELVDNTYTRLTTGEKYGYYVKIPNLVGGNLHYGVYSEVTKATGYAGYFLGRVSIGAAAGNEYILPATRGTNGQVMVTNGTGTVSWSSPNVAQSYFFHNTAIIYNVTLSDYTVRVGNTATGVNLPTPVGNTGKTFYIIGATGIAAKTFTTTAGTIIDDGVGTVSSLNAGEKYMVQSDGTDWIVINK